MYSRGPHLGVYKGLCVYLVFNNKTRKAASSTKEQDSIILWGFVPLKGRGRQQRIKRQLKDERENDGERNETDSAPGQTKKKKERKKVLAAGAAG